MTKENLYNAVGKVDDKYVADLVRFFDSRNKSGKMNAEVSVSDAEKTINVKRTNNKKLILRYLAAAAILVTLIAGIVMAAEKIKKNYSFSNVFTEDENFIYDLKLYAIEKWGIDDENIYICGYPPLNSTDLDLYILDFSGNLVKKVDVAKYGLRIDTQNIIDRDEIKIMSNGDVLINDNRKGIVLNKDLSLKAEIYISDEMISTRDYEFAEDSEGRYVLYRYMSLILLDNNMKIMKTIDVPDHGKLFEKDGMCYFIDTDSELTMFRIDFDKLDLSEVCKINVDSLVSSSYFVSKGSGIFDIFIYDSYGIYGYSIKNNSLVELVNYYESALTLPKNCQCCLMANTDKLLLMDSSISSAEYDNCLKIYHRSSEKRARKRTEIQYDFYGDQIEELEYAYNRTSNKYILKNINYNFENYEDSAELVDSYGDNVKPDIVFFNETIDEIEDFDSDDYVDIESLLGKDFLNKNDYFTNIIDLFRTDGKLYEIPIRFSLQGLKGSESQIGDNKDFNINKFYEIMKKEHTSRSNYIWGEGFIEANISEYVDFENRKCSFDNKEFVMLLEILTKSWFNRPDLQYVDSFSDTAHYLRDDFESLGFPLKDESKYLLVPEIRAAVLSS